MSRTNNLVVSLLLAGSIGVQADPSPTKREGGASFPLNKIAGQNLINKTDAPNQNWADANFDGTTGFIKEPAVQNSSSSALAGPYVLFRMNATNHAVVMPTQAISSGFADANSLQDSEAEQTSQTALAAEGFESLYQTDKDNAGEWQKVSAEVTAVSGTVVNTSYYNARKDNAGNKMGACDFSKFAFTTADELKNSFIACPQLVVPAAKSGDMTDTRYSFVKGRMAFYAKQSLAENNDAETDASTFEITNTFLADDDTAKKNYSFPALNPDIILGTMYQSNGSLDGGTTWCNNGDDNPTAFQITLSASEDKILQAMSGFGPKGKCTFQVKAPTNATYPVMQLTQATRADTLLQVIEWYDVANLTGNMIITPDNSVELEAPIGHSNTTGTNMSYNPENGVYFNPVKAGTSQYSAVLPAPTTLTIWGTQSEDAVKDIPNSIGSAVYYDRSTGQSNNDVRAVDSAWIVESIAQFNSALAVYDAAVDAYEAAKADYEADATKDRPTKVFASKPTYSGWQFNSCITDTAKTADCKDDDWSALKAVGVTTKEAYLNTGTVASPAFANADIGKKSNAITYLQVSTDIGDNTNTTRDEVGKTFGRLGQSSMTGTKNGKPFLYMAKKDEGAAGMQISLFPEVYVDGTNIVYDDWQMQESDRPKITVKAVAANSEGLSVATSSKTPSSAPEASTVGAQTLVAASIMAAAAISSTLF